MHALEQVLNTKDKTSVEAVFSAAAFLPANPSKREHIYKRAGFYSIPQMPSQFCSSSNSAHRQKIIFDIHINNLCGKLSVYWPSCMASMSARHVQDMGAENKGRNIAMHNPTSSQASL